MRFPLNLIASVAIAAVLPLVATAEITFSSDFESGCGMNFTQAEERLYTFEIPSDTQSVDRQWFYFRVSGAKDETLSFRLLETNKTNVTGHWNFARPVASPDEGKTWERINGETSHNRERFEYTFSHTFASDDELVAYHFPYTYTAYTEKLEEWKAHPLVDHHLIGESIQGRPIDLLHITDASSTEEKKGFWIIARQHSAETTGSYSVEGFIDFVLSDEPEAQALRRYAHIVVVPMMNPDGAYVGNYRNNVAGVNLNRVWNRADAETSPETLSVLIALDAWMKDDKPFDFFIDFHSDSGAREHYAYHAGPDTETPLYHTPAEYNRDLNRFLDLVAEGSPDFQPRKGGSNSAAMGLSYHYIRLTYGVLAMIPEGPYGDINFGENAGTWITQDRHRAVGAAFAKALHRFHDIPVTVESMEMAQ